MLEYVRNGITRPFVRLWLASSQHSWRQLPTPTDAPIAHAGGVNPDRILLVGSGIAVGYGVLSHELALGGAIARAVTAGTGRGTDVETIAAPELSPASARTALEGVALSRFDAVAIALGGPEALYLTPRWVWREQMRELFDSIRESAPDVLVFVIGLPRPPRILTLPPVYREVVARHGERLNQDARALAAARRGFHYIKFVPDRADLAMMASRQMYEDWASRIVPAMIGPLDDQVPSVPEKIDESARQSALVSLELRQEPDERFDRIVETARDLFEASGAFVHFIDGDRQWVKAAAGMPKRDRPRSESLCNITIRRAGLFLVEDLWSDRRFSGSSWAHSPTAPRFYAGYPVAAPDGHRIGVLCVVDRRPRKFVDAEAALLRELALRVQALVWEDARG
ncbi:MAG: hypothetical protein JWP85_492 [Rhodoglobus sp.]|nr:hypothetical protein [Rhodoglobus sp.]